MIASVGADDQGHSYNINADAAASAVAEALQAYKVMFLTDVAGWLRDPADPESLVSETSAPEVQAALGGVGGGMRPKLEACLESVRGRGRFRAHRRRTRARTRCCWNCSPTPDRARRSRRSWSPHEPLRAAGARAPLRDRHLCPRPRRVRARRGRACCGTPTVNEYLDFLAGISVLNVGHCHPRVARGGDRTAAAPHPCQQPVLHRARHAALPGARRELADGQGVPLQLGRGGERGGDQARAPRASQGARSSSPATPSTGAPTEPCRRRRRSPSRRRLRRSSPASCRGEDARVDRGGGRPADRRGPDRADPGRERRADRPGRRADRGARGVRPGRRRAHLRRGAVRDGAHRHALGLRADAGRPRRADERQGPGRRPADRRARHRPAARGRPAARRPRLDVRRRARRLCGRARRARALLGPAAAALRRPTSASGPGTRWRSCPGSRRSAAAA